MSTSRRRYLALAAPIAILLAFLLAMQAAAQTIEITAPSERLASPGEFVTLVFRVLASEDITADLTASSAEAWTILTPQRAEALQSARPNLAAVTVEVPSTAPAGTRDRITLEISSSTRTWAASTTITVSALSLVRIDAPASAVLDDQTIEATIVNAGNVPERGTVTVRRDDLVVASIPLDVPPGGTQSVPLTDDTPGRYVVTADTESGQTARAATTVISFGVPSPPQKHVTGQASLAVSSALDARGQVTLRGALSDFSVLDASLDAANVRRSFAEVDSVDQTAPWSVRVGLWGPAPFNLIGPNDVGVRGVFGAPHWSVGAAVGWVDADRFSGMVAAQGRWASWSVALGGGLRTGQPWAAGRVAIELARTASSLEAAWLENAVAASWTARTYEPSTQREGYFTARARGLGLGQPVLSASASVRHEDEASYASVDVDVSATAETQWTVGSVATVPWSLPAALSVQVQAGTAATYARLVAQHRLASGWAARYTGGLVIDHIGAGLELGARLQSSTQARSGAEITTDLIWYPNTNRLGGQLSARYQHPIGATDALLGASWDLSAQEARLSASTVIPWNTARLTASGGVRYGYGEEGSGWAVSATLGATYAFDLPVPATATEVAGGWDRGTLTGTVTAAGRGVPGLELRVGRYRLRTDETGRFRASLPPGHYDVALDLATVPLVYGTPEPKSAHVDVSTHGASTASFTLTPTSALKGRVLLDSNGDGTPDDPLKPVLANLVVTASDGLSRALKVVEDGRFRSRGLPPGTAEVAITGLPPGAIVPGGAIRTVDLAAGEVTDLQLLVQPGDRQARLFASSSLRIRSIDLEANRVPAGSAPLLTVQVQGAPDRVELESQGEVTRLRAAGDAWTGRIAVPEGYSEAVMRFQVTAFDAEGSSTRRGQVIVDNAVPLVSLIGGAAGRPGHTLTVSVGIIQAARDVSVTAPWGATATARETEPGRWEATLAIPSHQTDGVVTLGMTASLPDGREVHEDLRARILPPSP